MTGDEWTKNKAATPYADAAAENRQPSVHAAVEGCAKAVSMLREELERLEDRLASVLGPERPTPKDGATPSDRAEAAPLAVNLRDHESRLVFTAHRIRSLVDRLEV